MSDPIAQSRTNYFRVKDLEAFKKDLAIHGIKPDAWGDRGAEFILDDNPDNQPAGSIALFSYGFWPSFDEDAVADRLDLDAEEDEIPQEHESIEDLIAAHLIDTDVAILQGISFEKMRYINGYAVAVNARGEKKSLHLHDIYTLAEQLATTGTEITDATY